MSNPTRRLALCVALLGALPLVPAQGQGTITGVVRDSLSRPVAGADVVARPGDHRTRTDSLGRFALADLGADSYEVRARKMGFAPKSWDVKLSKDGHVDISIVFDQRMPMLDTMRVSAARECVQTSIEAFLCRRQRGGGVFLDYTDIDEKERKYSGDVFRDIPGFRVSFTVTQTGPRYVVSTSRMNGCITSLVDGRPASPANPIPELASTLIAVEAYTQPDSVPPELKQYVWPRDRPVAMSGGGIGSLTTTGRCTVVVYWTNRPPNMVTKTSP